MSSRKRQADFNPEKPETWRNLLTIQQTAEILNLSPWTLRKWDKNSKLNAIRIGTGKHRRFKKRDILKVLNEGL